MNAFFGTTSCLLVGLILSGGRVVADGPIEAILADEALLDENELELPYGFTVPARRAS